MEIMMSQMVKSIMTGCTNFTLEQAFRSTAIFQHFVIHQFSQFGVKVAIKRRNLAAATTNTELWQSFEEQLTG
jgi:chemotaxis protein CheY-P-specific phosphatase CheC